MTSVSDHTVAELIDQLRSHLASGAFRTALEVGERLAAEPPETEPAAGEAWTLVCRTRWEMCRLVDAEAAGLRAVSGLAAAVGRDHPLYAAAIRELARTYEELGRYTQAESLDRQALAIRRRVCGADHPDTAESLADLSVTLGWIGHFAEGEEAARAAVAVFETPAFARHPARVRAVVYLSLALSVSGKTQQATEAAREGHRLSEQLFPVGHPERATAAACLGRLVLLGYRMDEGERLLTAAIAARREALGEDHPRYVASLATFMALRVIQLSVEEGERVLRDCLRIVETALGPDHPSTGDALSRLAFTLVACEQLDEAIPLVRRSLDIFTRALGTDNVLTLDSELELAELLAQKGELDEAEQRCRRAMSRYPVAYPLLGTEAPLLLARVLAARGQFVDASSEALKAVRIHHEVPGAADLSVATALETLARFEMQLGESWSAASHVRKSFDIIARLAGDADPMTAEIAQFLAAALRQNGDTAEAEVILRRVITAQRIPAPTADLRSDLAATVCSLGRPDEAESLYQQILADRRRADPEGPGVADALLELGGFYADCGNLGAAEPRYLEAHEIRRATGGADSLGAIQVVCLLAGLRHRAGMLADALALYQQAREVFHTNPGETSSDYGSCLHGLGSVYFDANELTQAEPLLRQAVEVLSACGERTPTALSARHTLGNLLTAKGDYVVARDMLAAVLVAVREVFGPRHVTTAAVLSDLAATHIAAGDLLTAEPLVRDAAGTRRAVLGANHPALISDELRLSQVFSQFGEYDDAKRHAEQALELSRSAFGENSGDYTLALLQLADVHRLREDFNAAGDAMRTAIALRKRLFGDSHPIVAATLRRLSLLEVDRGRIGEARAAASECTRIIHAALGADHPDVATALQHEAWIHLATGGERGAVGLYRRAAELERKCHGDRNAIRAGGLVSLADCHLVLEEFTAAEKPLREAAELLRLTAMEEGVPHAALASRLATVLIQTDRRDEVGSLLRQSLAIRERVLGREHPDATGTARRLAGWLAARGQIADAIALVETAIPAEDTWGELEGISTFERHKAVMDALATDRQRIGLLVQAPEPERTQAAFARLIRNRAREAALVTVPPLTALERRGLSPTQSVSVIRLRRLRVQISMMTLAGPGGDGLEAHRTRLSQWRDEERKLATEVLASVDATPEAVARALPTGGTLIEFIRTLDDPDRSDSARYTAFVLRAGDPDSVRLFDLGAASVVDHFAEAWLATLTDGDGDQEAAGQRLAELILAPLWQLLSVPGTSEELFIVPDAILATVPFAALPTPTDACVIDRFAVTLLTSATALLDRRERPTQTTAAVITPSEQRGFLSRAFEWLTGRRDETPGLAVAASLNVTPRLDTEGWLGDFSAGVIHVAIPGAIDAEPALELDQRIVQFIDPLVRYGIRWEANRLSAARVARLSLAPGGLVVLADTVVGDGMREGASWVWRAWRHAGASAVVYCHWHCPGWDTHWVAFHEAVLAGQRPAVALRAAQLQARAADPSPTAWAGFVVSAG